MKTSDLQEVLSRYGLSLYQDYERSVYADFFSDQDSFLEFGVMMSDYDPSEPGDSEKRALLKETMCMNLFYWNFCYITDMEKWKSSFNFIEKDLLFPDDYLSTFPVFDIPDKNEPLRFSFTVYTPDSILSLLDITEEKMHLDLCPEYQFTRLFDLEAAKEQADNQIMKNITSFTELLNGPAIQTFIDELLEANVQYMEEYYP